VAAAPLSGNGVDVAAARGPARMAGPRNHAPVAGRLSPASPTCVPMPGPAASRRSMAPPACLRGRRPRLEVPPRPRAPPPGADPGVARGSGQNVPEPDAATPSPALRRRPSPARRPGPIAPPRPDRTGGPGEHAPLYRRLRRRRGRPRARSRRSATSPRTAPRAGPNRKPMRRCDMLKKRRFQKQNLVKVTFLLPDTPATRVHLMGDFNQWQQTVPMKRDRNNTWRATVDLEPGREYQFRYLLDGERWINDPEADGYVPSPFGVENSVVVT